MTSDLITRKLEIWKTKLLDITKRNRSLNFKFHVRSYIEFVHPDIHKIFEKLLFSKRILTFPPVFNPKTVSEDDIRLEFLKGYEFADLQNGELVKKFKKQYLKEIFYW